MSDMSIEQLLRLGRQQEADSLWRSQARRNPVFMHPNHDASPRVLHLVASDRSTSYLDGDCKLAKAYANGHWEAGHLLSDQGLGTITWRLLADTDPRKVVDFIHNTNREIIVNCIADPDLYAGTLAIAEQVVREAGLPVINAPQLVRQHTRDQVARRLQGIAGLRAPKTIRVVAQKDLRAPFDFPFIARACGTQTGETLELINHAKEFDAFLTAQAGRDVYLTCFVDFRSEDGLYRKYRVRVVGNDITPNHLLIDSQWKIHGLAARKFMLDKPLLIAEEAAYLSAPLKHLDVLRRIHACIDVDFYGVDYGVLPTGELLFFEGNAVMRSINPEWRQSFPQTWVITQQLVQRFTTHLKFVAQHRLP